MRWIELAQLDWEFTENNSKVGHVSGGWLVQIASWALVDMHASGH